MVANRGKFRMDIKTYGCERQREEPPKYSACPRKYYPSETMIRIVLDDFVAKAALLSFGATEAYTAYGQEVLFPPKTGRAHGYTTSRHPIAYPNQL